MSVWCVCACACAHVRSRVITTYSFMLFAIAWYISMSTFVTICSDGYKHEKQDVFNI